MLREFVYLDEVSVYSLIASRLGPIAAEFTETETASLQGEIASSFSAGLAIAKGQVNSRTLTNQTHGSQVLRRSVVQTTFKELYELEVDSLALRPMSEDLKPPKICSLQDLVAASKAVDGWVVDPERLTRGQLLEVEVQLEAEAIFRVSAVVSALLEMIQESPELFGLDRYGELVQARAVDRILAKLFVGLVPVRGHATDYEVVEFGEKEWIVHRRLLNELPVGNLLPTRPLYVVGVAEQSLFWKDIRRVVFSKARFRVLCRMAQDGIHDSWTPVKLAHVLEAVVPDLSNQIETAGSGALAAMIDASKSDRSTERKKQLMREALVAYATSLATHHGLSITAQDLTKVGLPSEHHCTSFGSLQERREAFNAITTFLIERFDLAPDPLIAAQYRTAALLDVGFHFSGQVMPLMASDDGPSAASSGERFLDSEFVAIYW